MNDELMDRIIELAGSGLCCSQILMQMVGLDARGEENPEMVKAMGALGYGLYSQLTCGALTGAACALALYRDSRDECKEELQELNQWFAERFGSCSCCDILGKGNPPTPHCQEIVLETVEKCFELLEEKL